MSELLQNYSGKASARIKYHNLLSKMMEQSSKQFFTVEEINVILDSIIPHDQKTFKRQGINDSQFSDIIKQHIKFLKRTYNN